MSSDSYLYNCTSNVFFMYCVNVKVSTKCTHPADICNPVVYILYICKALYSCSTQSLIIGNFQAMCTHVRTYVEEQYVPWLIFLLIEI